MSSNGTGLTSATTYQAIVIALVAAGIISIGVMSVCYRRRRRDEWERTVRAGLERARFRHGFGEMGGGGDGDELGEKPVLWDIDIGGSGEDWVPIRIGMDGTDKPKAINPTPHSFAPGDQANRPKDENSASQVEMTILIAMPHQSHPSISDQSTSDLAPIGVQDPTYTENAFTLSDLPHFRYTPTSQEVEDEEIPHIELGTTMVPLIITNVDEQGQIDELRLGTMGSRAGIAGDWGRVR